MYKKNLHKYILTVSLFLLMLCPVGCGALVSEEVQEEPVLELTDEEHFQALVDELFYENITESGLTLHSMLCHPENYGITEFPATFGTYSLENMKKNYQELHEMQEEL